MTKPHTKSPSKGKEESGSLSEAKGETGFKQNVIRLRGRNALVRWVDPGAQDPSEGLAPFRAALCLCFCSICSLP